MEWLLGIVASGIIAFITARLTARHEKELLKEELKLDYSIEAAIIHLLQNPNYKKRSLKKIKRHLRGFKDDDELRMALMRAGAIAFDGEGDAEMWGLLDRNAEDVK
jgi:hypothetical protein